VGGGVDAEHGGSWRPAARAFGVGREASHASALTLPSCARLGNPTTPGWRDRSSAAPTRCLIRALQPRSSFAAVHESACGTERRFAVHTIFVRFWHIASRSDALNLRPLLEANRK